MGEVIDPIEFEDLAKTVQRQGQEIDDLKVRLTAVEEGPEKPSPGPFGVCLKGFDDSAECDAPSIYQRQQKGCRGTACVIYSNEYYRNYRAQKKAETEGSAPPD